MKKLIILAIVIIFASCSDNLEDLNQNIKDPSTVLGESLFTSAQKSLVDQMVDLNVNNNNTKLWVQYLQETTYTDESNYDQTTRTIPGRHWSILYKDVLKDLDEAAKVISATTYNLPEDEALKPNKLTIIEILNIYTYSILVETFGDIPYEEALDIDNLSPQYDDGLTIYEDLIERLTIAIDNLDTGLGSFGTADRIYNGNVTKWKKFAASLKLRMGILLSDVDNTFAQEAVEEAVAAGVFTSNNDNAEYAYLSADPNTNPIHANLVLSGRQDFVAATTILDIMQPREYEYLEDTNENGEIDSDDARTVVPGSVTSTDPRLAYYFDSNVDADPSVSEIVYFGGEIGQTASYNSHSHVSERVESATNPGVIFDYAEVEFLLAEASARSFNVGGTPKEHYDAGIMASCEYWEVPEGEAADYLTQPHVDYDTAIASSSAATPWKEVIGTQKYIALYNRGFEAWTSIRLLDYPLLATPADAVSGFPTRYTYPIVEQTLNSSNWEAASDAIGGDLAETKLFFDIF
ncbi:SusD/RagB family nutrient-binding outer membrane lipoprotein [Abyssalbus ytuae]|uniref:SusD/RagB family nutrient-binding outer membrane lipoprotein n=1 Tax=Abyssalbus ytuae TaxID=2926907 RepID=A0A9E6ZIW9_9FLAO|nr:SusD/RagB family nutrient-binding outer membrane lipoprotein [Abyssalbus ytuae]UOB16379.1 SusD/RagB family nutrient-binding outer membrane lipoprotein [Abyssalbus ytuae]